MIRNRLTSGSMFKMSPVVRIFTTLEEYSAAIVTMKS